MTRNKSEYGGILLFLGASVVIIFLFAALAIDVGWIAYVKQEAQLAVDAAAMAGAAACPECYGAGDQEKVKKLVSAFNDGKIANSIMGKSPHIYPVDTDIDYINFDFSKDEYDIIDPNDFYLSNGVRVEKTYAVPHFFGAFTGAFATEVKVSAAAALAGVECISPTLPIALINCPANGSAGIDYCSPEVCPAEGEIAGQILLQNQISDTAQGAYYIAALPDADGLSDEEKTKKTNSASADACKAVVAGTLPQQLCADTMIYLNNGAMTSCLQDMNQKLNSLKGTEPYTGIVPVLNCESFKQSFGQVKQTGVQILGFAKIEILELMMGSDKGIKFAIKCGFPDEQNGVPGGLCCGLTARAPVMVR